ncbi:hypothetical protein [Caballeronia glebae]|uniref:hypothetical protein n=1 Tax=Caballeronia glebae TaxID=1777143 RepID=UPI0038B6FCF3
MREIIFFLIATTAFFATSEAHSLQHSQTEPTLCSDSEDVYFSCPLKNGKTVSVCAKNNIDPNHGYVRYNYGDEGARFIFPNKFIPPDTIFTVSDVSGGTIRGLHLKFSNGPYTYIVSSVWPGEVYVSKNGKIIFEEECKASPNKSFSNKIFDGIKQTLPTKIDDH